MKEKLIIYDAALKSTFKLLVKFSSEEIKKWYKKKKHQNLKI